MYHYLVRSRCLHTVQRTVQCTHVTLVRRTHTRSARRCHVYFRCLYKQPMHSCIACFVTAVLRSLPLPLLSTPRPRGLGPDYYDYYDITSGDESVKNPSSSFRHFSATVPGSSLLLRRSGNSTPRPSPIFRQFSYYVSTSLLHFPSLLRFAATMADAVFNSFNTSQKVGRKLTLLEARVTFAAVHQRDSQSVEEFASELRAAAGDCKFGATLDTRLRDQFVFGLVPGVIHDLLSEEDYNITFSDAVKRASDLELEQFGSRPLLVPDWLAPQSTSESSESEWFSSDPLAPNNSAPVGSIQSTPIVQIGDKTPDPDIADLQLISVEHHAKARTETESSSLSVALAPTPHSEPLLQLERCDASSPVGSVQSAPFEPIGGRIPDPDPSNVQPYRGSARNPDLDLPDLQLKSEDLHLANVRTETPLSDLDRRTPDSATTDFQVSCTQHFAEARTETYRSQLYFSLGSTGLQFVQSGALHDQRGSSCALTSTSSLLKRWSRLTSFSALPNARLRSGRPDLINSGGGLSFISPVKLKLSRLHCNHRKRRRWSG